MSLLPVIDPGAIKQHRIAVNDENNSRHVSVAFALGVKATTDKRRPRARPPRSPGDLVRERAARPRHRDTVDTYCQDVEDRLPRQSNVHRVGRVDP